MTRAIVFYLFGVLACVFGLVAVTRRNPVHGALHLVLSLLSLAVVYITLGALFLAMAQVFVYAGAIMVLFLFVIMMIGTRPEELARRAREGFAFGLIAALLLLGAILQSFTFIPGGGSWDPLHPGTGGAAIAVAEVGAREMAGPLIGSAGAFGEHALAFELGSILVLVAIVGAILLTRGRNR